mmetsp:Transcript_9879/g.37264  ORF Transcript_9879/g.37264 Transcript_9879/m.37264 type:complete len:465 (+) Transcript_9879:1961-3355(+)
MLRTRRSAGEILHRRSEMLHLLHTLILDKHPTTKSRYPEESFRRGRESRCPLYASRSLLDLAATSLFTSTVQGYENASTIVDAATHHMSSSIPKSGQQSHLRRRAAELSDESMQLGDLAGILAADPEDAERALWGLDGEELHRLVVILLLDDRRHLVLGRKAEGFHPLGNVVVVYAENHVFVLLFALVELNDVGRGDSTAQHEESRLPSLEASRRGEDVAGLGQDRALRRVVGLFNAAELDANGSGNLPKQLQDLVVIEAMHIVSVDGHQDGLRYHALLVSGPTRDEDLRNRRLGLFGASLRVDVLTLEEHAELLLEVEGDFVLFSDGMAVGGLLDLGLESGVEEVPRTSIGRKLILVHVGGRATRGGYGRRRRFLCHGRRSAAQRRYRRLEAVAAPKLWEHSSAAEIGEHLRSLPLQIVNFLGVRLLRGQERVEGRCTGARRERVVAVEGVGRSRRKGIALAI